MHSGAGHPDGTLVNGLLALYPEMASVGDEHRPGIVHRLDRDTSGLLVAARTAARVRQSRDPDLRADRRAPVRRARVGRVQLAARCDRRADRPLHVAAHADGRARDGQGGAHRVRGAPRVRRRRCARCSTAGSRPAAPIRSGCTSSAIGHPLVGDGTYGGAREAIPLDRPFLHAAVLGFDQPTTGERLRFEDPLPPDLAEVLRRLESDA